MSPRVTLQPEGREVVFGEGETLGEALVRAGVPLNLYCGGRGICGKCSVEVLAGTPHDEDENERRLRQTKSLLSESRLACRLRLRHDLSIRVPSASLLPSMPVLVTGKRRLVVFDPVLKKIAFRLRSTEPPSADEPLSALRSLWPGIETRPGASLSTLPEIPLSPSGEWALTAVVFGDGELLDLEAGDTSTRVFGLAIDLGTTTLVAELVDLSSGRSLGTAAGLNGQTSFGADVVSRISAAYRNPGRLEELRAAVVRTLDDLVRELLDRLGVAPEEVYEAVVAGNTAMNHMFLGVSVDGLAVSPFEGAFLDRPPLPAAETGLTMNPRGKVLLVPNIGSFVGGDITAGLVAGDLEELSGRRLFIDLGTNGEIVLKNGDRFVATSTAAGPAFEGLALSCGMLALPGAVYKASAGRSGGFDVETIGGLPPRGVCGTGLIDLVAEALAAGLVTSGGQVVNASRRLPVAEGIDLTQPDVRELQLAAAAVKTGIRMLLEAEGLAVADLDEIFVAGAFGTYLNFENAMKVGLFPRLEAGRLTLLGNASLAGARAFLLSRSERARGERLARRVCHVALAKGGDFQTKFIESLELKEWT